MRIARGAEHATASKTFVTPVEKWRLRVELCPLLVIDVDRKNGVLVATLNVDRRVVVNATHSLYLVPERDNAAAVKLDHGLSALFSRAAWYRLVELAEVRGGETGVASGETFFALEPPV